MLYEHGSPCSRGVGEVLLEQTVSQGRWAQMDSSARCSRATDEGAALADLCIRHVVLEKQVEAARNVSQPLKHCGNQGCKESMQLGPTAS